MSDWQVIPTGIWTRLHGHDVEIYHNAGHSVSVRVVDGALDYNEPDVIFVLRPPGGASAWRDGWRAPMYQLGGEPLRHRGHAVTPEDFYISVDTDGPILECPHDDCPWAHPIEPSDDLRWALGAARDHLDDKEANHG